MADFLGAVRDNVTGGGDFSSGANRLLDTGIDKDRSNFLKGLKTTTSGQKEDPTYLGFRLLFDFNPAALIDFETFLPVSPLLCPKANYESGGMDFFTGSKRVRQSIANPGKAYPGNATGITAYYSALGYLKERASSEEAGNANSNGGNAAGGGTTSGSFRQDCLKTFQNLLLSINQKSPWFIKSIDGLDKVLELSVNRSYPSSSNKPRINRSGKLTFNCMDSIDLRTTALADLYRKATFDTQYMRSLVPQNLRKFRMWIIVTELRNMHLTQDLLDVLNPFNNSAIGSVTRNILDIGQASGILNGSTVDPSKTPGYNDTVYDKLSKFEPYIFMYQLDECEFDFDSYTHLGTSLNNEGFTNPAVSNKFGVYVGKIKEMKLQYNILSDLLKNKTQFKSMVIADSWNLSGSSVPTDATIDNDGNLFAKLANNFINNSVSSVIQQYTPVVSKAVLGNAYGFQLSDLSNLTTSFQNAVTGIQNLKSPFDDARPQSKGLGGPSERVYPSIKEDVYGNVNPKYFLAQTNVYPGGTGYGVLNPEDVYPTDPGVDLGLPKRVYPTIVNDQYPTVPGPGLGVPARVYPNPKEDVYPTDPGPDLGLPTRIYGTIPPINDQYPNVPGSDLGAPARIYSAPNDDEYPTDPGVDLGLPDRVYPSITNDQYPTVPGTDLGAPGRVYPAPKDDEYPTDPGVDLGLPSRVYPGIINDQYPTVPGADLGNPGRVYPAPNDDEYPTNPGVDLGLPGRVYPNIVLDQYPTVPGADLGNPGRVYSTPNDDEYPSVPGTDLGLPDRVYPSIVKDEYPGVPGADLGRLGRVYSAPNDDEYPTVPGKDLSLPDRVYPAITKDEYQDVPGRDLGIPGRVYSNPNSDVYPTVPGADLSVPNRVYPTINSRVYPSVGTPQGLQTKIDVYPTVPGSDLGLPDRSYPPVPPQ